MYSWQFMEDQAICEDSGGRLKAGNILYFQHDYKKGTFLEYLLL